VAYAFVTSLYWSFCRDDLRSPPELVGLANYQRLADELFTGGRFGQAVWNTAYYALVSVPRSIALGSGCFSSSSRGMVSSAHCCI
jgi:multiple sugar transport system permease protein